MLIDYLCNCPFRLNPYVYLKRGGMVENPEYWRLDNLLKKKAVSMHDACLSYTYYERQPYYYVLGTIAAGYFCIIDRLKTKGFGMS